jgi:hypothetical protein
MHLNESKHYKLDGNSNCVITDTGTDVMHRSTVGNLNKCPEYKHNENKT